jgi:hypothetical protein
MVGLRCRSIASWCLGHVTDSREYVHSFMLRVNTCEHGQPIGVQHNPDARGLHAPVECRQPSWCQVLFYHCGILRLWINTYKYVIFREIHINLPSFTTYFDVRQGKEVLTHKLIASSSPFSHGCFAAKAAWSMEVGQIHHSIKITNTLTYCIACRVCIHASDAMYDAGPDSGGHWPPQGRQSATSWRTCVETLVPDSSRACGIRQWGTSGTTPLKGWSFSGSETMVSELIPFFNAYPD